MVLNIYNPIYSLHSISYGAHGTSENEKRGMCISSIYI